MTPSAIRVMVPAVIRLERQRRAEHAADLRVALHGDDKQFRELLRRLTPDSQKDIEYGD